MRKFDVLLHSKHFLDRKSTLIEFSDEEMVKNVKKYKKKNEGKCENFDVC